jgi:hypothetical protein
MAIPESSNASDSRLQGTLKNLRHTLSALSPVDRAFIAFKASLGILLMVPLVQLPSVQDNTTTLFLAVWCAITFIGFWISLAGLLISANKQYEDRHRGFRIEMIGLWLLFAGPAVFAAIMLGVWVIGGEQRATALAFAVVICLAIRARMAMVSEAHKKRTVIVYPEDFPDED